MGFTCRHFFYYIEQKNFLLMNKCRFWIFVDYIIVFVVFVGDCPYFRFLLQIAGFVAEAFYVQIFFWCTNVPFMMELTKFFYTVICWPGLGK